MKRAAFALTMAAFGLSGCNLLFPEDPRIGDEDKGACEGRVRTSLTYQQSEQLRTASGQWVPTYTYDITKLGFDAVKALSVPGTDETAGTRLMRETNETSAAVERFMAMKVDEKGALFLGRSPSLYRVRGKAQPASQILANGCARQQTNMRLFAVTWKRQRR
ncbi:MAG: hypothetical protein AAFQ90_12075 [Pseudomonadota bacterium]